MGLPESFVLFVLGSRWWPVGGHKGKVKGFWCLYSKFWGRLQSTEHTVTLGCTSSNPLPLCSTLKADNNTHPLFFFLSFLLSTFTHLSTLTLTWIIFTANRTRKSFNFDSEWSRKSPSMFKVCCLTADNLHTFVDELNHRSISSWGWSKFWETVSPLHDCFGWSL